MRWVWLVAPLVFGCACTGLAQQTVFNVPNGDVLERGKVYGELDFTYKHADNSTGFTPRIVVGIGKQVEIGLNVNGLGTPADLQTTLSPTLKWKAYDGGKNGLALLVGDDLFVPVQNKRYNAGNYVWSEVTKTWERKTRATFGAYYFTSNVVAPAQRAGGQFAIEQPFGTHLTLAADWYTGDQALGYFTPGFIIKLTPKLTVYLTYQLANHGIATGNHQFLTELGCNFN